jgi:hypothetical protein
MSFAELELSAASYIRVEGLTSLGNPVHKVAQILTFPNIVGRNAPGKSLATNRPALVTDMAFVGFSNSSAVVKYALWSSSGTNGFFSSEYALPDNLSTFKKVAIQPRPVLTGTRYYAGFFVTNPVQAPDGNLGFGWGVVEGPNTAQSPGARGDIVPASQSTNFISQFASVAAGPGSLAYILYYDVLPTAPTSPSTVISGPASTSITLTWGLVESDGGQAVSGYRIQRSTDNVTFTTIVSDSNSTSRVFVDTNLTPGTTYFYRVAAINAVAIAHGSDYSGPYSVSTGILVPGASAGNATSLVTVTVADPEPNPIVFSDSGSGIRFTQIDVQYGSEYLYNEIEASTQDSFSEIQIAEAPQSKTLYGVRSYEISNLLNATDSGAFDVAKDYLTYYYQPELRVDSVTVDLSNLSLEEKLQILALEIDSYISVSFTPNRVGDPKVSSGLVTGISHRITLTSHQVELRLRNERNLFTLDSDSKGILDVNILGP